MSTTPETELVEIVGLYGAYADAYVLDEANHLVFLSIWGRDTAIQELLARLTVPVRDGGLEQFKLRHANGREMFALPGDPGRLTKHNGRMPRENLHGDVVHLWLYQPLVEEPDRANRRAILLDDSRFRQPDPTVFSDKVWSLLKEISHLPLHNSWQATLIEHFTTKGWVKPLTKVFGMTAIQLELGAPEVELAITELIHQGRLTLHAA